MCSDLEPWYEQNVGKRFCLLPDRRILALLTKESELNEIVKLIGSDVLPDDQKLVLEIARVIRLGFLQQNAYHPSDTYVPLSKQLKMMEVIPYICTINARRSSASSMPMSLLREDPVFEDVHCDQIQCGQ